MRKIIERKMSILSILSILIILSILLFLLIGCSVQPNKTGDLVSKSIFIEDIPVIETYIDDGKEKPLLIIQHGFKNRKESMVDFSKELAEKGFFVVAPDAYAHGERFEKPCSLVEVIVNTSKEYDRIIDDYNWDERVNNKSIGVVGFSMGGCIAFHYTAYGEHPVRAIAPTISTPYFEQLMGSNLGKSLYSAKSGLEIASQQDRIDQINQFILDNSPFEDCKSLRDVAILMQNGELDTYIDSEGVEMLNTALKPINKDVQLIMVPDIKHQVSSDMKDNIVTFMCKYLLPDAQNNLH